MAFLRQSLSKSSLIQHFSVIEDPRKAGLCDHLLIDMLVIAVLSVICGADGWDEIHDWGRSKEAMLGRILTLPAGIPSADTFRRLFARIAPVAFERAFRGWVGALIGDCTERLIAIDGKAVRGAARHSPMGKGLHLVHAWSVSNRMLLGQVATGEKSNEITAIPELLDLLDLQGALVTIDAMGCQRSIARQIIVGGGDYLLTLKDNQPSLLAAVTEAVAQAEPTAPSEACSWSAEFSEGHGRQEVRRVIATSAAALSEAERWEGLRSCGVMECTRTVGEHTSTERRYFITSLGHRDGDRLSSSLRGHWSIENHLHWTLDVAFREDACTVHEGHGPENLSLLRKIALTALKAATSFKASIARRRKRAGWDDKYLLDVLRCGIM